jgi:hypothetical protein
MPLKIVDVTKFIEDMAVEITKTASQAGSEIVQYCPHTVTQCCIRGVVVRSLRTLDLNSPPISWRWSVPIYFSLVFHVDEDLTI